MSITDEFSRMISPGIVYNYENLFDPYKYSHDILSDIVGFNTKLVLILSEVYLDTLKAYSHFDWVYESEEKEFWENVCFIFEHLGIPSMQRRMSSESMEMYINGAITKFLNLRKYDMLGNIFKDYYRLLKRYYDTLYSVIIPQ